MTTPKTVFVQNWEESERGWGVRPDGFTVHISKAQRDIYVGWYNKTFNNSPSAPDEYTRVSGDPLEVEADEELFDKVKQVSQKKREDGSIVSCVHGKGGFFSSTPMRSIKDEDIAWPVT